MNSTEFDHIYGVDRFQMIIRLLKVSERFERCTPSEDPGLSKLRDERGRVCSILCLKFSTYSLRSASIFSLALVPHLNVSTLGEGLQLISLFYRCHLFRKEHSKLIAVVIRTG